MMKDLAKGLGCLCALLTASAALGQTTVKVYVDGVNGTPAGGGTTWTDAAKYLSDGIAAGAVLALGDPLDDIQVWVAAIPGGAYYADESAASPAGTGDMSSSFDVHNHVSLYGGFAGTETDLFERDETINETVLDGDIDGDGTFTGSTAHVLYADEPIQRTTRVSGFTVRGGNAWNGLLTRGGGMLVDSTGQSGLVTPLVDRCIFTANNGQFGGGLYAELAGVDSQRFRVVSCSFLGNSASNGGGIAVNGSLLIPGQPGFGEIFNCVVADNTALASGAGLHLADQFVRMTNCTVVENQNTSVFDGDGIATPSGISSVKLTMTNCILWDNGQGATEDEQILLGSNPSTVDYTDVQGLMNLGGTMNVDVDPLFVDAPNGDFRLTLASPLIDQGDGDANAGTQTVLPVDLEDIDEDGDIAERYPDRDLNLRLIDGDTVPGFFIDMGAYEFQVGCPADVNKDGAVNVLDLLAVLAAWGPCPGCPEDVIVDGQVNVFDLLEVLAKWGSCLNPGNTSMPESVSDCLQRYGFTDKGAACILAVTAGGS